MAWAEKLPSGKYRGLYRDASGAKRSAGTFTHKPRAVRAAGAREELARKSMRRDPEAFRRPWGEWVEEWWPTRQVEKSTLSNDAHRRRLHLEPRWEHEPIGSITRQDVRAWAIDLAVTKGLSAESVKRCVHLLSASLSAAMDAEILDANPAARMRLPKGAIEQERYLTHDEYDLLRDAMPTTDDALTLDLLVHTGLRWGELAGLHLSRVDLKRGTLRVVETFDEEAGEIKAYPKGRRAREVPLTDEVIERVKVSLEGRDLSGDCGLPHASGRCPGPLLMTGKGGGPLRNSNWSGRVWKKALETSEIGHARIHDCRHTYASWLLQQGIPLAEVGRLLGHVSPQTTQRYAHLAETPSVAVRLALAAPRKSHEGGREAPKSA